MANQFNKYTGNVTGQVGSLITALNAALVTGQGWTSPFTGTNLATYRAPSGNQLYLYVNDSAPVTAQESRITGYESMTAVPPGGTNPFPTAAQNAAGNSIACMIARKSATADATNRSYQIFADARTVYVFILTGDAAATYLTFMFGEFFSLVNSDAWNTMLVGRRAENSATISSDSLDLINYASGGLAVTTNGHYIARAYNGLPTVNGSLWVGLHGDSVKGPGSNFNSFGTYGTCTYPNSPDGGLYLSPLWIHEPGTSVIRGRMRGLWQICHPVAGFNDGDTFSGTGDLAGKTFQIIKATGNTALYCVETSATLETN